MALGTEVGDAYITVHADTTRFRADLSRLNRVLGNATKRNREFADSLGRVDKALVKHSRLARTSGTAMRNLGNETQRAGRKVNSSRSIFEKFADGVSRRWRRMDSTVRLVLSLILAAGPQMATLGSVVSSSLTSIAAAALGAVLALAPLLGALTALGPLVTGVVVVFDQIKPIFKDLGKILDATAKTVSGPFIGAIRKMTGIIADIFDAKAFKAVFDALTSIVTTINSTLTSDVGKKAMTAIFGPLLDAITTIINAFNGPLLTAFLTFITATAPVAQQLADMFAGWAQGIADFFAATSASGELQGFFEAMIAPLQAMLDLFGALKDVIGTIFLAAVGPGTEFINIIVRLLEIWNEWMQSIEGQAALQEWFDNLFAVLPAIFNLLGALGTAIAELVTPQAVAATVSLLDSLAELAPILGDVLALLSEAGIIDVLAAAIQALGEVITPLVGPFGELLSAMSGGIIESLGELAPNFTAVGESLGALAVALAPVVPTLLNLLVEIIQGLTPALAAVTPLLTGLVSVLASSEAIVDAIAIAFGVKLVASLVQSTIAMGKLTAAWVLGTVAKAKDLAITAALAAMYAKDFLVALGQSIAMQVQYLALMAQTLIAKTRDIAVSVAQRVAIAATTAAQWLLNSSLLATTASFIRNAAAMVAANAVMIAVRVATVAATAAQWLLNVALSANPIGLIVAAIAALVAGLVLFFTKTEVGQKIWAALVDGFRAGWEWIQDAFTKGVEVAKNLLNGLWEFIKTVWKWSPIGFIVSNWDKIKAAFALAIDTIKDVFQGIWDFIKKVWSYSPIGIITTNWDKILDFIKGIPGKIKSFFSNLGDTISAPFKEAFNSIARFWNNTVGKLSFTAPDWVPGIGGKGWSLPKIPTFARGAVLDQPTFGMFAEAGREALVPLDRPLSQVDPSVRWLSAIAQGKGGTTNSNSATVTINTPATDPRLIASILEDELFDNWR